MEEVSYHIYAKDKVLYCNLPQDDFNPRQIDWRKLFELEDNEQVESYIEEL